jgi:hypothetical protein
MPREPTLVWSALGIVVGGTLVGGCVGEREATTTSAVGSEAAASDGVSETGVVATTDTSTTPGELVPTSSSAGSSGDSTSGFLVMLDGGGVDECDVFTQDCDAGEKCAAWASDGGSAWNATKCVPVMGDRKPGEPCTVVESAVSGLDDCIKGAMCFDVDAEGHGECVALCMDEAMPVCADPGSSCYISGDGVLNLCIPTCDPLIQDCPADEVCLPLYWPYSCNDDLSGDLGAAFDACEFVTSCDKGLLCLSPQAATECDQDADGCCLPMCSIAEAGAGCPGAGQECLPVYDPQPPGYEDVGYCSLPL